MMSTRAVQALGAIAALGFMFAVANQAATAATFSWNSAGGADWGTASNWLNNAVPGGADVASFSGGSYAAQPNLAAAFSLGGLWDTGTAALTVGGSTLTLNGTTIANPSTGIQMDPGAGALTVKSAIALGTAQSWFNNSSSALVLTGPIFNGGHALTLAGSGNFYLNGAVSGGGGLTMNGTGKVTVGAGASYAGTTVVSAGTLQLQPAQGDIGIKFAQGQNAAAHNVTGIAGVVPIGNWNNFMSYQVMAQQPLHDNAGNASAATVTWINPLQNVGWSIMTTDFTDQNYQLLNSYGDNTNGNNNRQGISATVSNIPYAAYDVYVYFGSDGNGRTGSVSLGNQTYFYTTSANQGSGTNSTAYQFTRTGVSSGITNPSANFAEFSNVSGSSFTITQTRGSNNSGMAAIEIVPRNQTVLSAAPLQIASGTTVDLGGVNQVVASLSDFSPGAGGTVTNSTPSTAVLTLTPTSGSTTFSGTIQNGAGVNGAGFVGLVMNGSGTQVLAGGNTFTGGTVVNSGNLVLAKGGTAGTVLGTLTINPGGQVTLKAADALGSVAATAVSTLAINGGVLDNATAGNNGTASSVILTGGTMKSSGGGAFNLSSGFNITSSASAVPSAISGPINIAGTNLQFTVGQGTVPGGADLTVSGRITGSGFQKSGPGKMVLTGSNVYTGPTTVNGGTLALSGSGSIGATPSISLTNGAVLDVAGLNPIFTVGAGQVLSAGRFTSPATDINGNIASGGTLAPQGTLTINGGLTLNGGLIAPSFTSTATRSVSLGPTSTLVLNNTTTVRPYYMANGTYTVIGGYLTRAGAGTMSIGSSLLGNANFRGSASTSLNVGATSVTDTISGLTPASLTWTGTGGNNNWDVNTTSNWLNAGVADKFFHGDAVTMDDTAGTNTAVAIPGSVYPSAMTVSTTGTYAFSGAGGISGPGTLTKQGAGMLVVGNSGNTYSGGTFINGGTLQVQNASVANTSLGVGPITVAAGAQLYLNAPATGAITQDYLANAITLSGTTPGGAIASGNQSTNNVNTMAGTITLASTANVTNFSNDRILNFAGQITGPGGLIFDLSQLSGSQPGGAFLLSNSGNNYAGPTLAGGTSGTTRLYLGADNAIPSTSNLTLSNASLYLNGHTVTLPTITGTNTYNIQNGSTNPATLVLGAGNATSTFGGQILDNGAALPGGPNASTTSAATAFFVTGQTSLIKTGLGLLSITNNSNYFTGNVTINGGTLQVAGAGGAVNCGLGDLEVSGKLVTINSGAVLQLNNTGGNTLAGGNAYLPFTLVVNAGGLLTGPSAGTATNNSVGNLQLNGGTLQTYTGYGAQYEAYNISGSVSVGGSAPSYIVAGGTANNGINLGCAGNSYGVIQGAGYQTLFVVNPTGGTGADLTVTVPMANTSNGNNTNSTGFIKNGNGSMLLSGASIYSGTATINAGTVIISADNNLGTPAASVTLNGGVLTTTAGITNSHVFTIGASGGTINVASTDTGNYQYYFNTTNALSGSGPLTVTGPGTLTASLGNIRLDHTNTYGGPITLQQGGIFEYGISGAVGGPSSFTINNQGELAVQGSSATTLPNNITIAGGTNSVLSFENGNNGVVSGSIALNANVVFAMRDWFNYGAARSGTISGPISGTGAMTINSGSSAGGVLTLTNSTNSFTSGIMVANSLVSAPLDAALGAVPGSPATNITLNNGGIYNDGNAVNGTNSYVLNLNAHRNILISGAGYVEAGWGGGTGGKVVVNGQINGSGDLRVIWDGGAVVLNGSDSYTGNTLIGTVLGGTYYNNVAATPTLQLGNSNALPATTTVTFGVHPNVPSNAATLDLNGYSSLIVGLTGGSNAVVNNSAAGTSSTLTVGNNNGSAMYAGTLENTGAGATLALVKVGSGLQNLGGASTYTGGTTISAGTLQLGNAASLGAATGTLTVNNGVLDLNGVGVTVGRLSGAAGVITSNAAGSPVLMVNNPAPTTFSGTFVNGAAGTPGLTLGSGMLTLLGANSSNGPTTVSSGAILQVGSGATLGGATGTALSMAGGTLMLGDGNGTSGIVRVSSLAGPTGAIVGGNAATSTLTVNCNGPGPNIFSGTIGGSGANQNNIALTLTGSGVQTLAGSNYYTGPTTINNGVLNVNGVLASTPVTVNAGGALQGSGDNVTTGIVGGGVTVKAQATVNLASANNSSALTINGGLTIGGTGAYGLANQSTLRYTLGSNGIEPLDLGPGGSPTGTVTLNSGGVYLSFVGTPPAPGTYILMKFGGTAGAGSFSLDPIQVKTTTRYQFDTFGITTSGNALTLSISGAPSVGVAYFYAGNGTFNWSDGTGAPNVSNWSLDKDGEIDADTLPGATTDVILTATNFSGAPLTTMLGANTTINSLNVSASGASSNTIAADGSSLKIMAAGDSNSDFDGSYTGNPAGRGISIAAGAGPLTISAGVPVLLGKSQTWANNSSSIVTIAGNVAGTGSSSVTQTLTISNAGSGSMLISGVIGDGSVGGLLALAVSSTGSGVAILSGSNTYSGGTTLSAGRLALGNANALGTGSLSVNGGQMNIAGYNIGLPSLNGAGGTITNTGTAATLTVQSGSYGGTITDGTGTIALVKSASGVLTLSGTNNYSGGTTVLGGGTLIVTNPAAIRDGTNLYVADTSADLSLVGYPAPIVPSLAPASAASSIATVPEPGTLLLAIAAGIGASFAIRRRKLKCPIAE
jgi:autotransporter-associated beta strand protein